PGKTPSAIEVQGAPPVRKQERVQVIQTPGEVVRRQTERDQTAAHYQQDYNLPWLHRYHVIQYAAIELVRSLRQRPALRRAQPGQEPGVYRHRGRVAGPRHRR